MGVLSEARQDELAQMDARIAHDLMQIDKIISEYSASDVATVQEVASHLIKSGGKRLRPKLVVLAAYACGGLKSEEACEVAVVIEFIHSATLLHDDVVDDAEMRRHHKAARMLWGNEASILVGDFLYSRAFQLLAKRNNTPLMQLLARTTAMLSEGEVHQLTQLQNHSTTKESYFKIIAAKTGALFAASSQAGAMIAQPNQSDLHQSLYQYGMNLGIAFQIMDDMLDYSADAVVLGKVVGKDLFEGKMTLPLIDLLAVATLQERAFLYHAIQYPDEKHLDQVIGLLQKYTILEQSYEQAGHYAKLAKQSIDALVDSDFKQSLMYLSDYAIARSH